MMAIPPDVGYDDRDFKVVAIGKAKPHPQVVSALEILLERAKLGELRSLVWVAELQDESHDNGRQGTYTVMTLLGQLTRLIHKIQLDADEASRINTQEGG